MRVAVVLLVLVLITSLMPETEAGWLRRTWRGIKRTVRDRVRFRVGVTIRRTTRSAEKADMSLQGCQLSDILHHYGCDVDGGNVISKEMENAIFEKSDVDQSNHLSDEEKRVFELMYLAEILETCLEQKAVASDNDVQ